MEKFTKKFKNTFFSTQFIKFVIIGVINTFNGVVFAYIYSSFLDANLAFIFGYTTGLIISYILNSIFTFKEKLEIIKFIKFIISSIPNYLVQQITVIIIINILGLHKLIAYGLAAMIGVPVTFIILKVFAFKKTKD